MGKVILNDLSSLANETSVIATINANNAAIEEGFNNTISRDGTSPNTLEDDLNMNTHRVYNVPLIPLTNADVATKYYVDVLAGTLDPANDAFDNIVIDGTLTVNGTSDFNAAVNIDANLVADSATIAGDLTVQDDIFLTSGGVINWNNGDVTATHSANALTIAGGNFDAPVLATGSSTARNLTARSADIVNVKDYGATGDGTTNDSSAVSAAITALLALGGAGATLYFPRGKYRLDSAQTVTLPSGLYSFNMKGDGQDSTVLYFPSSAGMTVNASDDLHSVHITDLSMTTGATGGGTALTLNNSVLLGVIQQSDVSRCTFRGDDGGALSNRWTTCINVVGLSMISFEDILCYGDSGSGNGISLTGNAVTSPNYGIIYNFDRCTFLECGVGIEYGSYIQGVSVSQCNFTNGVTGIHVPSGAVGATQLAVTSSQFDCTAGNIFIEAPIAGLQVTNSLFYIATNGYGIVTTSTGFQCAITGNVFSGEPSSTTTAGVSIQGNITGSTCVGNTFYDLDVGIDLSGTSTWQVNMNTFESVTTAVSSPGSNIVFTDSATAWSPKTSDGQALGTTSLMWSDLFLASGGVINWNNGDVTATHAANTLTFAGADTRYTFASDEDAGTTELRVHNTSDGNVTTKLAALNFAGTDTVGTVKETVRIEALPGDSNWTAADLRIYTRTGDTVTHALTIASNQSVKAVSPTGGIGYGTGAGGTVVQATSKSTGVTLNKVCGQITMNGAALAAGTTVSFTLTNSAIAAGDVLVLNHVSTGTAGAYLLNAQAGAGSASINVRNVTAGSLSEAIVIGFAVIKATTS